MIHSNIPKRPTVLAAAAVRAAFCLALTLVITSTAQAQDRVLEEIVVTATKRTGTLQDTAIAISAFDSELQDQMNLGSPLDYETVVPSMTVRIFPNRISIRGVGRFSNSLGVHPGVATYYDGAYLAELAALYSQPLNIERVEILRGPQGTLFGRNTTGGAAVVTTKRPGDEFKAEVRGKYGNYEDVDAQVLVSGPINDTMRAKLYMSHNERDGWQDNRSGRDTGDNDTQYYEGQFDWDVTDRLNAWFKVGHIDSDYTPSQASLLSLYDNVNFSRDPLGFSPQFFQTLGGVQNDTDPFKVDANDPGKVKLDRHYQITWDFQYDFDAVTVNLLGNYNHYNWDQRRRDFDATSNPDFRSVETIAQHQTIWSQEIQFTSNSDGPLSWVAGLYYNNDQNWQPYIIEDMDRPYFETVVNGLFDALPGVVPDLYWPAVNNPQGLTDNPGQFYYAQEGEISTNSYAAYGEMNYAFNDNWAMTFGLRYSYDSYRADEGQVIYALSDIYVPPGLAFFVCTAPFPDGFGFDPALCLPQSGANFSKSQTTDSHDEDDDNVSGRVILEWTPTDDHLFWGTIATGYKAGGVRLGALQDIDVQEAERSGRANFEPEEVTMLEAGWKGSLSDTLQVEAVVFYYDYKDMQQLDPYLSEISGLILNDVINIDTEMWGIELTSRYVWGEHLSLFANYSYNSTEIAEDFLTLDNTFCRCVQNLEGNDLTSTPEHKASLHADWAWNTDIGAFSVGGTYSYVGSRQNDLYNTSAIEADSYTRLDAYLRWASPSDKLAVEIAGKNLNDEEYYNSLSGARSTYPFSVDPQLQIWGRAGQPRTYWLEVQYRL